MDINADLSKCGKYIENTKEYLSNQAVEESGISQIPANTVVMSFKLSIGKTAITSEPMYSNEAIMSFRDKMVTDILPDYIYYLFFNRDWSEGTNKAVMGKTLNKANLSKIKVNIPDMKSQQKVVEVLDKVNNIIDARKSELKELNKLIKARFVEMFGDPLENKKSWKILNAGEICTITDGSHFSPEGIEKGYPMLSVKNMRNDGFHYENCKFISQENYDVLVKQGCKPLKNDVLIAKDGSYFYYGFVVKKEREQAILSSIAILRPDLTQVLPEYLCKYMLSTEIVKLVGRNYVTGAAIKRVILKGIKQIPVMLPPLELQQEFSDFVNQVDKSKVAVQKALDETQLLFDSLMQEYFG